MTKLPCLLAVAAPLLCGVRPATYAAGQETVRIATFNVSLFGARSGEIADRLATPGDRQAECLAEIIQRVRPDVLLLNEFDFDERGDSLAAFRQNYLAVPQHASGVDEGLARPIDYPYWLIAPTNTGQASGFDLNRDGHVGGALGSETYASDCWGFGRYPGHYGMALLSRFPIDADAVRTFRKFRWLDLPGARLPDDPAHPGGGDWYPPEALNRFPLTSKSHWDVPIRVADRAIHVLASHPTPPTFDGPEDRNGLRNHDEIKFWRTYVDGGEAAAAIYDDSGRRGGLADGASFVIAGDLNSDPLDGDSPAGIRQLLTSPRLATQPVPGSEGGRQQAALQGGANRRHRGDPAHDTCDPADEPGPGNLRIDYVLASSDLDVVSAGVFWPPVEDPLFPLVGVHPFPGSDHRLVWIDVATGGNTTTNDRPPRNPGGR